MLPSKDHPLQPYNISRNRRRGSRELDVFEAAQYFSSGNGCEALILADAGGLVQRKKTLDMSLHHLDIGRRSNMLLDDNNKKKKKGKMTSPGGRLATFLNSFFHLQKKTSTATMAMKKDDELNGCSSSHARRKRRSSISSFLSMRSCDPAAETKPPAPFSSLQDQESTTAAEEPRRLRYHHGSWRKAAVPVGVFSENDGMYSVERKWVLNKDSSTSPPTSMEVWMPYEMVGEIDGGESDSSSDLFELPTYSL